MIFEKRISRFFGLKDDEWLRHANPVSVWTRFIILPFLSLSIWSRVWIGWYALFPILILLLWAYINPRFFKKPKTTKSWAAKSVLGEKIWANRDQIVVPDHHKSIITMLTALQLAGGVVLAIGLYKLHLWMTLCGITLMAKMWFLDRMVWIFEEMKGHPEYRRLLY